MQHAPWNPDYFAEFRRRIRTRNRLLNDPDLQRQYQLYYKYNCVAWIEDWAITFDPRISELPVMPFKLFSRQVEFVNFILGCLKDKEHGLVEKSRDMGATWLCCAISVWLWLYHPGAVVGWGSMTEDDIDEKGNPKAIFTKIRMLLDNLPRWMMPRSFKMSVHAPHMRIVNPENDSSIIGEAGIRMGRGGRTSIYFKDESAHYDRPELIEAALGDNTNVQIDMSSVNGSGNVFYRRRMAGEEWFIDRQSTSGKVRVFIFDWRENPLKNQAWYDARKQKAIDEGLLHVFAQEVDRDYAGSIQGIIIMPEWVRSSFDAHIKLGFSDEGERMAGQDVADGGQDKNALAITYGVVLRHCDHWGGEAGAAARKAIPICQEHKVGWLNYDSVGVGSGFKTELNTMRNEGTVPERLRISPWSGGDSVLDPDEHIIPGDPESRTNKQQYYNLKAQSYWRLRNRFYKTYQAVEHGKSYPPEELISIDSNIPLKNQLLMELCQIVSKTNTKGQQLIDKKPNGTPSPNLADSVDIAYSPQREISILDVL